MQEGAGGRIATGAGSRLSLFAGEKLSLGGGVWGGVAVCWRKHRGRIATGAGLPHAWGMTSFTPDMIAALIALTGMEIVLGIDNVVFIAVLISRLPEAQQRIARGFGLLLALALRLAMLGLVMALVAETAPVIRPLGWPLSWRDIILIGGGVFLIVKATHEMHIEAEGGAHLEDRPVSPSRLTSAIVQIALINLVFSIDSTVTAIGMSRSYPLMVAAIIIAMLVMYVAAGTVSRFLRRHPAAKMLALAFLMLIGVALLAEGLGTPFERPVIYAAMLLAAAVSLLSMGGARRRRLRQLQATRLASKAARSASARS
jgi:predicted tellurium resistance membrane protein TerC